MNLAAKLLLIVLCISGFMLWGCHSDISKADSSAVNHTKEFLTKLTSVHEPERFKVQGTAIATMAAIDLPDLESALTALHEKNVSTLIYVCIQTGNDVLYRLSPPAKMAVENAAGAFPNIAYYYARVNSSRGLNELQRLYRRYPDRRLPICLAVGEIHQPAARKFLLAEAKAAKSAGDSVVAHLFALKDASAFIQPSQVYWMLGQKLDREEVIALAEIQVKFTDVQLQSLWRSGAAKKRFALESVMGNPEGYFDSLCWIVKQYLDVEDFDSVRQILLSDSMRSASSSRVRQYRQSVLQKLKTRPDDSL